MTLELYTELKNEIEPKVNMLSDLVQSFPKNEMGLTIRTEEFIKAKRNFDLAFNQLQVLNKKTSNQIKKQYLINKNGGSIYKTKITI